MINKRKFQITSDFVPFEQEKKEMNSKAETQVQEEKRTTFTIIVDEYFKRQVKAWCAHKNIPIKKAFVIALKEFMKNNPH